MAALSIGTLLAVPGEVEVRPRRPRRAMTRSTGDVDDGPDTEGATTTGDGVAAISDAACGVERSARGASAAAAGFLAFFFQPFKFRRPSPFSLSSSTTSTGVALLRREAGVGMRRGPSALRQLFKLRGGGWNTRTGLIPTVHMENGHRG